MMKLINLIYINLLSFFDINKILVSKEDNTKSGYECKPVLLVIFSIIIGYVFYSIFNILIGYLNDKRLLIVIAFIISSLLSLFISIYVSSKELFNVDFEYLYSLPVSKNNIIISKLFNIYLKNILFILIIMSMSLVSYNNIIKVDKTLFLFVIVESFIIPIIPIILSSMVTYFNTYIENKYNKLFSFLVKIIFIIILIIIYNLLFSNINDFNNIVNVIINKLSIIYIPNILFKYSIFKSSLLALLSFILLSLLFNYIFIKYLSNNYIKLVSYLKYSSKNRVVKNYYYNKHNVLGSLLIKDKNILFNNNKYFKIAYSSQIILSIVLLIILNIVDIPDLGVYIILIPTFLATIVCINSFCISGISMEKGNLSNLKTYPVRFSKVLLSKYLLGIIIGSLFIIFNATIINIYLKLDKFIVIMNYLCPFIALLFTNLLYLTLDYRFYNKDQLDDSIILSMRVIVFIPPLVGILLSLIPFIFPIYANNRYVLICELLILIILLFVNIIYLFISGKKIYNKIG